MRAILVDDEPLMMKRFVRLSSDKQDIFITGQFDCGEDAIEFVKNNQVEIAFIDIKMPVMDGLQLAEELRKLREDILIVFITAYDEYIRQSNEMGADYYVVKPYSQQALEKMMENIRLIARKQERNIYIRSFGRFTVLKNGKPVALTGKAKEILALVMTKRGKEISNEEIFSTIWEGRPYSNTNMSVYYNALRRLKKKLKEEELSEILISTTRGQMINTDIVDCDYYAWLDKNVDIRDRFEGEFLSEYSWGESILAEIFGE